MSFHGKYSGRLRPQRQSLPFSLFSQSDAPRRICRNPLATLASLSLLLAPHAPAADALASHPLTSYALATGGRIAGVPAAEAPPAVANQQPATLAETWEKARGHLFRGEQAEALDALDALEARFGQEPEYRAALPQMLPLYARLCLQQSRPQDAARLCEQWLALSQPASPATAQVWDTLGSAKEQLGDYAGAIAAAQALAAVAQDAPRRQYSRLRIASLNALAGNTAQALSELEALGSDKDFPLPLRTRARLQALWLACENGLDAEANRLLLQHPWQVSQMPELAELSTLARRIGDIQLEAGNPADALLAYHLVCPPQDLLALQHAARERVRQALQRQQAQSLAGSAQAAAAIAFLSAQLAQIDAQLKALEGEQDSYPAHLFHKAYALLRAERAWEAAALFQILADAPAQTVNAKLARLAAFHRLLALRQSRRENALQAEADAIARRYPGEETAARAMLLKAESLRRTGRFADAIATANTLLQSASLQSASLQSTEPPNTGLQSTTLQGAGQQSDATAAKRLRAHAHLERGYAHALLGRHDDAHADFSAARDAATGEYATAEDGSGKNEAGKNGTGQDAALPALRGWAACWIGQNHLLAADYPAAATAFADWLAAHRGHEAEAMALFGKAQACYGLNRFEQAQQHLLEQLSAKNVSAALRQPASLLYAETLVALGHPDEAEAWLAKLETGLEGASGEPWKTQAFLRRAQIAHHSGRSEDALALYLNYARSGQPGYAAAILHAAQIHTTLGRRDEAAHLLADALATSADAPATEGVEALFAKAHALGVSPAFAATKPEPNPERPVPHPAQESTHAQEPYDLWLEQARAHALTRGHRCAYARLSLQLAQWHAQANRDDLADALRLQTAHAVTPADLDNHSLASLALYLSRQDSALAAAFLTALQQRTPGGQPAAAELQLARAFAAQHAGDAAAALEQTRSLSAAWPLHPLREQSLIVQARAALTLGQQTESAQAWQQLLALPQAPAQSRSEALLGLARHHRAAQQLPAAIHYYQRLYTLYRGEHAALAAAYLESAPLFEALGDTAAALATYDELLNSLGDTLPAEQLAQAQAQRARLLAMPDNSQTKAAP